VTVHVPPSLQRLHGLSLAPVWAQVSFLTQCFKLSPTVGFRSLYTATKRPHCNMTLIAAQRRLFGNCDLDHADRRQWDHVTQPHAIGGCEIIWNACITINAPHNQINQVSRTLS
jgi:hypothetical protein